MTKIASLQAIAAVLLACGLSGAPAKAAADQTFVSGTGTDSGSCTRVAPCRTFSFALTQTNPGGEIDVLNTAGYGVVTINQAVSIVNDGVGVAGIKAASGNAISIQAGASDSIHLRGLTITGSGLSGTNGIAFGTGRNLTIENCAIRNFETAIFIGPTTSSSFSVSNTIASNNVTGIFIQPIASAVVTGVLRNIIANDNNTGISVEGKITTGASLNVTIADSETSNNLTGSGVDVDSTIGQASTAILVRNVVARFNNLGLRAQGTGILRVAHSVVTANTTGVDTSGGGIIFSYGDNDIDGNTTNNTGVLNTILTH